MISTDIRPTDATDEKLRAAVLEAFGDSGRMFADALLARITAADPSFGTLASGELKTLLAGLGLTPAEGPGGWRYYQRSAAIGPRPGSEELLASLADIAALGRSARAAAESHAAEQRRADKERVGRQRASEAAIWWRTRFGVDGVEPRMLTWTGYPLPDSRASWQASESGRIHAVAHLGGPVFLTHHSRSTYGEYGTTEHTMTVVAPCVCGQVREHDIADIPDLGDVLDDIAANACAGTCTPSERTVHDPDASDF